MFVQEICFKLLWLEEIFLFILGKGIFLEFVILIFFKLLGGNINTWVRGIGVENLEKVCKYWGKKV